MSITDELREFAPHLDLGKVALAGWKEALLAIADRIDVEHEQMLYGFQREFDEWKHDRDTCWVKLPVDADGEVIHVRDKLDGYGKTITVVEMRYGRSGWVLISEYGNAYADCFAFTHHHAPTVEDVLREFAFQIGQSATDDAIVAEYAQRLQLREVDE